MVSHLNRYLIILCGLLFSFPALVFPQGIRSYVEMDSANFRIGDPIVLNLTVDHPFDYSIDWHQNFTSSQNFQVLHQSSVDSIRQRTFITEKRTITLVTFDTGRLRTPSLTVWYRDNAGALKSDKTNQVSINVSTVSTNLNQPFRSIALPLHVTSFNYIRFVAIFFFILAGALGTFIYLRWKKKRKELRDAALKEMLAPQVSPIDLLRQIEAKRQQQQITSEEYYVSLTQILREYIESKFSYPATEHTSREIIIYLGKKITEPDFLLRLSEDFQLADLVKFARVQPTSYENARVMNSAIEFVKKTEHV